jgi:hypothetical protein
MTELPTHERRCGYRSWQSIAGHAADPPVGLVWVLTGFRLGLNHLRGELGMGKIPHYALCAMRATF